MGGSSAIPSISRSFLNKEALAFTFNASLSYVNVARAYARQQGHNLLVSSTKNQPHNAARADRFIAISAKHANLRLKRTFILRRERRGVESELLFLDVKEQVMTSWVIISVL